MLKVSSYFLIIILMPAIILTIYYPGLSGGFVFDDFSNILHPPGIQMQAFTWDELKNAALSMDRRPIARASFGLNYLVSGFSPYAFKATNIAIHSLNALLLFSVLLLLLRHQSKTVPTSKNEIHTVLLALAISLAWALHPVNLTNVLYSVQRMNSLSALFVLSGILSYVQGRLTLDKNAVRAWLLIAASIFIFLPLAWFSKENGALLPLFLFIVELTFFRFATSSKQQRNGLYLFYVVFLLLPGLLAGFYILNHAGLFHQGYGNRYFSLAERLLTEPRVIWIYLRMILLPAPSAFGLFHDDVTISTSLVEPLTTITAITCLLALLLIALASIKRAAILAFGLLFFFAGHLMESTFIPLELVFEHRNYLPSIGILMIFFYYLLHAGKTEEYKKLRLSIISLFILIFALQTHIRARQWSDNVNLYLTDVQFHPDSARANYEAGKVYGQRLEQGIGESEINYQYAIKYFARVTTLKNNTTSGLFGSILTSIDSGSEINPVWIDELERRLNSYPLEQVNLEWLNKLTDCISKEKCQKHELQIPRLLNAAISYPRASAKNRSLLYAIYAKYSYQIDRKPNQAVKMAQKAILQNPSNLYHHINLVKYLIAAGNYDEAHKNLELIIQADTYGRFTTETTTLKYILEKNIHNNKR